ncbi:MAG TPA: ArsO family NAD(P)H-dependent flavin-containing monooxygenase [Microlunatus sp.]
MAVGQVRDADVVIVGGGQAALAAGYYLQRANRDRSSVGAAPLRFVLMDQRPTAGGAWSDGWESLRLFSPAAYGSLPGWPMPPEKGSSETPSAEHVRRYLEDYEQRYQLPVQRPVTVTGVERNPESYGFRVATDQGSWSARSVISATGTWARPFWPRYPGMTTFRGRQLHTQHYRRADDFEKARVLVVGGGNSAAQITADLARRQDGTVTWVTLRPPRYLPDDIDGRALFDIATRAVRSANPAQQGVGSLGDIVAVPTVREARDRGLLNAQPMFDRLTPTGVAWDDPHRQVTVDVILWCTGFRPDLAHLTGMGLARHHGHPVTDADLPTRSADHRGLFFLGYGDWCGPASATLIGVGPAARATVSVLLAELGDSAGVRAEPAAQISVSRRPHQPSRPPHRYPRSTAAGCPSGGGQ